MREGGLMGDWGCFNLTVITDRANVSVIVINEPGSLALERLLDFIIGNRVNQSKYY